jgi:hypothetical protein
MGWEIWLIRLIRPKSRIADVMPLGREHAVSVARRGPSDDVRDRIQTLSRVAPNACPTHDAALERGCGGSSSNYRREEG